MKFTANKNDVKRLTPTIGSKHPNSTLSNLRCSGVNIVVENALAKMTVSYAGIRDKEAKMPTGGATRSTVETNIALHANYKKRPNTWVEDKYIFGDGPSPNAFGRITESSAGAFLYFGPLPDGKNGRPGAACGCPSDNKYERGICHLQGVESFIEQGSVTYRYSGLSKNNFMNAKIKRNLGKIVDIQSRDVPVPDLVDGANWLLVNVSVEVICIGAFGAGGDTYFQTNVECLSSGPGGWNTYIYQKGDALNLDNELGSTPV
jgi:hypothetical protein